MNRDRWSGPLLDLLAPGKVVLIAGSGAGRVAYGATRTALMYHLLAAYAEAGRPAVYVWDGSGSGWPDRFLGRWREVRAYTHRDVDSRLEPALRAAAGGLCCVRYAQQLAGAVFPSPGDAAAWLGSLRRPDVCLVTAVDRTRSMAREQVADVWIETEPVGDGVSVRFLKPALPGFEYPVLPPIPLRSREVKRR